MKTQLRATVAWLLFLLATPTLYAAQIPLPTTLDTLVGTGDFVTVGDLTFDDFNYVWGGDMPIASQINVEAAADGLRFTGPFVDLPGGAGNGGSDATLGFPVTSMSSTISEVSLSGNPSLLGGVGSGVAAVTETFAGDAMTKLDIFDNASAVNLISTASVSPTSSLTVTKDILLLSTDPVESAVLSVIEQAFVPGTSQCFLADGGTPWSWTRSTSSLSLPQFGRKRESTQREARSTSRWSGFFRAVNSRVLESRLGF